VYASGVGAVLLVIDARRRDLTNVERVVSALQDRDVKILGVVINRSRRKVRAGGYYAQAGARRAVPAPPPIAAPPAVAPAAAPEAPPEPEPEPDPVVETPPDPAPTPTAPAERAPAEPSWPGSSDDSWPPPATPQQRWEWPRPDPATPSD
jgi:hypothetical protein